MIKSSDTPTAAEKLDDLAASPDLAEALESDRFKQFLDHVPVAILVGEIADITEERIVYANKEAEELLSLKATELTGAGWERLDGRFAGEDRPVSGAFASEESVTRSMLPSEPGSIDRFVEITTALVMDADDRACFRLVALIEGSARSGAFEAQLREKDFLLREIQHRVKNNLQMITALIRMETKRAGDLIGTGSFERLAGRIEALGLLYRQLEFEPGASELDLGSLLSQIAGSVMRAQAVEGVRLDLQVEPCMASINVAMPVGLMVNELLTNSMKHAFGGRSEGVVALRCLKEDDICVVELRDDGVGMPEGVVWPQPGKLGALMVRSLTDNARASIETTAPEGGGVATSIRFPLTA